jgi:hypothetical protein
MNYKARLMPTLIVSAFCMRCATTQQGMVLSDTPLVTIHCVYTGTNRHLNKSEVECTLVNQGDSPARVHFKKASLEDPFAEIQPIDVQKIKKQEFLENVAVILGVIVIIGILVAVATKNKSAYIPQVHIYVPNSAAGSSKQPVSQAVSTEKRPIYDTIELPGHRSATLIFAVKHGLKKPQTLVLELDGEILLVRVPIKAPFGQSTGRSNFDY